MVVSAGGELVLGVMVSVPCGACGKVLRDGDEFCEACGARVTDAAKQAMAQQLWDREAARGNYDKHAKSARTTMVVLAVMFLLGGVAFFFLAQSQAEKALVNLAAAADSELLLEETAGAKTVGELRAAIHREPYQLLGLNVFLAAVMLGLWYWSKRALLPATITAFGIYVTLIVANGMADPKTLAQGVLVKIFVIAALVKGIHSAFTARKFELPT